MWAVALYVVAGFVLVVLSVWAFRKWFRVHASCWFCHADVKIPFRFRNCWDCPHCDQYNGFTETGDYNKPIPAMYGKEKMHQQRFTQLRPRYSPPLSEVALDSGNGLCDRCNKNQSLKIRQLANFVPSCEELFDEELPSFRRRLEQIYALCVNCQEVVRSELTKQHSKFGTTTSSKNGYNRSPKRRQRRDSASPGRVGSMLSSLSLGGCTESEPSQRSASSGYHSILAPARFQPPSSPSSSFRLSGGSSSFNEQSYLWPSRFHSPKKTTYDSDDAVSVFSSVSQRFRRPTRTDDSKCSHTANSDGFWKGVVCLVLLCSFSTNALVLYYLLTRG